ncbi:MAG: PEP-CTERM sorting domain-containing protein [Planctomycetia bacterium]
MAINIVPTFNSSASDYPSFDPDGSGLIALMGAVETYYEDIFENSGTLNVEFYYDSIDKLGIHNNKGTSGGHPTSCRIRIDSTGRNWYIDQTPFDNSEYNMQQTLARDLGSLGDIYDGNTPDLLEYSYKGDSNGSTPAASGATDMFSVLLHEMGHGLGMTGATAWWETFWDEDYDINSNLVWGNSMGVECCYDEEKSEWNYYHIEARTMMYPYISSSRRKLPSATDLFAIACAGDWGGSLDLKRKEFYATGTNPDMNAHANWSGNWNPDSTEDAWIRHGGSAKMTDHLSVNNLYIGGDTIVRTDSYDLEVDENCTLGDSTGYGQLSVQEYGELRVGEKLRINSGSTLKLKFDSEVYVDTLDIRGEIIGTGMIMVDSVFFLNGKITTDGGAITVYSDVPVDLDGGGNSELYVTGGNFYCNNTLHDWHDGYIKVGSGYHFSFSEGFTLGINGVFDLDGSTANPEIHTTNGTLELHGTVNITNDAEFYGERITIESTSTINALSSLEDFNIYNGDLYIEAGATLTGSGQVHYFAYDTCTFQDGASPDVSMLFHHGDVQVEDNGIGEITTTDTFEVLDGATLIIEADGDESCDLIDVNSTAYLDGTLEMEFIDGYTPADGDTFTVMEYNGRNGTFDSITWDGTFDLIANYTSSALILTVDYGDSCTTVPEPSTIALLFSALAALGAAITRKRHGK